MTEVLPGTRVRLPAGAAGGLSLRGWYCPDSQEPFDAELIASLSMFAHGAADESPPRFNTNANQATQHGRLSRPQCRLPHHGLRNESFRWP